MAPATPLPPSLRQAEGQDLVGGIVGSPSLRAAGNIEILQGSAHLLDFPRRQSLKVGNHLADVHDIGIFVMHVEQVDLVG